MKLNSKIIPFNDIVFQVSEMLGLDNLHNKLPILKKYVVNAEMEINPYSSLLVKKRMTYHVGNGNFDGRNIVLPKDFIRLDTIGCCNDGLCKDQYLITPTFIVLCDNKKRTSIVFTYYGLACDGTGNPFTTENHREAILSYIEYMFYRPKMNKGVGNMNYYIQLQRNWEDRALASRGNDAMSEIFEDLEQSLIYNSMANQDILEFEKSMNLDSCECSTCFVVDYNDNEYMNKKVYHFQFNSPSDMTEIESLSDNDFIEKQKSFNLSEALKGMMFNHTSIGKYGFIIEDVEEDSIDIKDLLNTSLDNTLDKYYDDDNKRLIFLSKNLISHCSIFLKFVYNG